MISFILIADTIPTHKSPVRRRLDLASSLRPRDSAPKPTTPIRLTDISAVQHDDYDDDNDDDDIIQGESKVISTLFIETYQKADAQYY